MHETGYQGVFEYGAETRAGEELGGAFGKEDVEEGAAGGFEFGRGVVDEG